MKKLAFAVILLLAHAGCLGTPEKSDEVEVRTDAVFGVGSYASVGNASWTGGVGFQAAHANTTFSFNASTGKYLFHRVDATLKFLTCDFVMTKKSTNVPWPGSFNRQTIGNVNYYQQSADAACTWGTSAFTVKTNIAGPWQIWPTDPYPLPGENMAAAERANFTCCGANGNTSGSGNFTVSVLNYLDPGVTLHVGQHYISPTCSTCGLDLSAQPRAEEATWHGVWGMTARIPDILWRAHDCNGGFSWPFDAPAVECDKGLKYGDYFDMFIALDRNNLVESPPYGTPLSQQALTRISDSAFSHELCHAVAWISGVPGDPLRGDAHHTGPCFCNANEPIGVYGFDGLGGSGSHMKAGDPCIFWPEHGEVGIANTILKNQGL